MSWKENKEGLPPGFICHLDHLVMTVRSTADSVAFYSQVLGMEVVTFKVQRAQGLLWVQGWGGTLRIGEGGASRFDKSGDLAWAFLLVSSPFGPVAGLCENDVS